MKAEHGAAVRARGTWRIAETHVAAYHNALLPCIHHGYNGGAGAIAAAA